MAKHLMDMNSNEIKSKIATRNTKIQSLIGMIITSENDVPLNELIRKVEEITILKLELTEAESREEFEVFYKKHVEPR